MLLLPVLGSRDAHAKLEAKEWRQVEQDALKLFANPGEREAKTAVLARLVEDGEKRAWKHIVEALVKEAEHWVTTQQAVREKELQIDEVQSKPMAKRYPQEQRDLVVWKQELETLETAARDELAVLDELTEVVAKGPEALRKNLFNRVEGPRRVVGARGRRPRGCRAARGGALVRVPHQGALRRQGPPRADGRARGPRRTPGGGAGPAGRRRRQER